jgi:hypothetical protein
MKRQRQGKGILSSILTLALAVVLCMSFAVPAFAAPDENGAINGDETTPAMAAIRKVLQMPAGTTTPGATFTFAFAKVSVTDADVSTMPDISNKTVTYTAANAGDIVGDVKSVPLEVNVLGATETAATFFPHAGVYEYTITEVSDAPANYDPDEDTEILTYSGAVYTIRFYVRYKTGDYTNETYVHAIGVTKENDDEGVEVGAPKPKVDPTPNSGGGLVFTNTYVKSGDGGTPSNPDNWVLAIGKDVAGPYADRSKYFTYTLDVGKASLVPGTPIYKAYVVDDGYNVVTSTENATPLADGTHGKYIAVTAGTAATIKLKHGQKIVFTDLPIGSNYVAVETGEAYYTPKVTMVIDGGAAFDRSAAEGANLSTGTASAAEAVLIGEDPNTASFVNTYRTITPTGILIDNLPFIVILLGAVGAFILFIVVKSRKRREENPSQN